MMPTRFLADLRAGAVAMLVCAACGSGRVRETRSKGHIACQSCGVAALFPRDHFHLITAGGSSDETDKGEPTA